MSIWAWLQPGNRIWKVISDYEKGFIVVYDENGEIVFERKGLTKEVISFIEANFFSIVAINISNSKAGNDFRGAKKTSTDLDNPMYV